MPDNYVIEGEWQDAEWQALAAKRKNDVSATAEASRIKNEKYWAGPRTHPYGIHAFKVIVAGQCRVYPTKDAAVADGAITENTVHENGVGPAVDDAPHG